MDNKESFKEKQERFLEALRRIGNGECRVRERIIKEGAHSYVISGKELESYERWENDVKYKNDCLEKQNKELRKEIDELKKKLENKQTIVNNSDTYIDGFLKSKESNNNYDPVADIVMTVLFTIGILYTIIVGFCIYLGYYNV